MIGYGREGRHSRSPVKMGYAMRMGDKLVGNEDVWEAGLQQYQRKREQEVDDLAALSLEDIVRPQLLMELMKRRDCVYKALCVLMVDQTVYLLPWKRLNRSSTQKAQ